MALPGGLSSRPAPAPRVLRAPHPQESHPRGHRLLGVLFQGSISLSSPNAPTGLFILTLHPANNRPAEVTSPGPLGLELQRDPGMCPGGVEGLWGA